MVSATSHRCESREAWSHRRLPPWCGFGLWHPRPDTERWLSSPGIEVSSLAAPEPFDVLERRAGFAACSSIGRLFGPRVVDDPQLNEQPELVGSDPFPDDLVS